MSSTCHAFPHLGGGAMDGDLQRNRNVGRVRDLGGGGAVPVRRQRSRARLDDDAIVAPAEFDVASNPPEMLATREVLAHILAQTTALARPGLFLRLSIVTAISESVRHLKHQMSPGRRVAS